jgi:hypothetical protein
MRKAAHLSSTIGLLFCLPAVAEYYQETVLRFNPTYYYQLNETETTGGAVDSTGNAAPGVYNGDYDNGPAEVGVSGPLEVNGGIPVPGVGGAANLAHLSNNSGHITLGDGNDYGASAMTVALFFKAGQGAQGGDRVFTNNLTDPTKSFQINVGNNGLVFAVDPSATGFNAERTLADQAHLQEASGWYHLIVSTEGATGAERAANLRLWVNGEERTADLSFPATGWGTDTGMAKIGGRRANATDTTTHSGGQDEVAIWLDRVLTEEEVASLWNSAITAKPQPVVITELTHDRNPGGDEFVIKWLSKQGKLYNLRSETQPGDSGRIDWPLYDPAGDDRYENIVAAPPENTLRLPQPADPFRLFVIEEFNAPPVTLVSYDFDNGPGDWVAGAVGAAGTVWEHGTPANVGPPAAHSGVQCWGTVIDAIYPNAPDGTWDEVILRSPEIDLTLAGGATLKFHHWADFEGPPFDWGTIRVLDAANDAELVVLEAEILSQFVPEWKEVKLTFPPAALGKVIKLEFSFTSDDVDSGPQAGWYFDDVVVTVP